MTLAEKITDRILNQPLSKASKASVGKAVDSAPTLHELAERIATQDYIALDLFGHTPSQAGQIVAYWASELIKEWADRNQVL